jgi:hypothetical protein
VKTWQRTPARIGIVLVLLLAVVLAQNIAATRAPSGTSSETGRLIGRAGFAYLSGMRTFAAAVLWNRLDPQYDLYYHQRDLGHDTQMLPTMWIVQMLDPQFVQSYYIASWIVSRHGDPQGGFDVIREGIRNNPRSGLLRAGYIQLMFLNDRQGYIHDAVAQADAGTAPGVIWTARDEKMESYAVFATAYHLAGLTSKEKAVRAVVASLEGD